MNSYQRLLDLLDTYTEDHVVEDRHLAGALATLRAQGLDPHKLEHARATVLFNGGPAFSTPPTYLDTHAGRVALASLLNMSCPPASLRVLPPEEPGKPYIVDQDHSTSPALSDVPTELPTLGPVDIGRNTRAIVCTPQYFSTSGQVPKARQSSGMLSRIERIRPMYGEPVAPREPVTYKGPAAPAVFIPLVDDGLPSAQAWNEAVAASSLYGASSERVEAYWTAPPTGGTLPAVNDIRPCQVSSLAVAPTLWEQADRRIAMVWLALSESLERQTSIGLHDGRLLLPLGRDLMAEVRIRDVPDLPERTFASLLSSPLNPHVARLYLSEPSSSIPKRVVLGAGRLRADVTFFHSDLAPRWPSPSLTKH